MSFGRADIGSVRFVFLIILSSVPSELLSISVTPRFLEFLESVLVVMAEDTVLAPPRPLPREGPEPSLASGFRSW